MIFPPASKRLIRIPAQPISSPFWILIWRCWSEFSSKRISERWLPVWWAGLLTICLISIYTILVGVAPAVVRAAVMSCLAMSGRLIGRRQAGPFTLLITAAIMCAFNPLLIWEAGFQLSFMATLGLVLYADRLMNWFKQRVEPVFSQDIIERISGPVGEYFLFHAGCPGYHTACYSLPFLECDLTFNLTGQSADLTRAAFNHDPGRHFGCQRIIHPRSGKNSVNDRLAAIGLYEQNRHLII